MKIYSKCFNKGCVILQYTFHSCSKVDGKEMATYQRDFQTKEQEEIERLMNIIICENKRSPQELAK